MHFRSLLHPLKRWGGTIDLVALRKIQLPYMLTVLCATQRNRTSRVVLPYLWIVRQPCAVKGHCGIGIYQRDERLAACTVASQGQLWPAGIC